MTSLSYVSERKIAALHLWLIDNRQNTATQHAFTYVAALIDDLWQLNPG